MLGRFKPRALPDMSSGGSPYGAYIDLCEAHNVSTEHLMTAHD